MRSRSGLAQAGIKADLDSMVGIRIFTGIPAVQLQNFISEKKHSQRYVQEKDGNIVSHRSWKVTSMMAKSMMQESQQLYRQKKINGRKQLFVNRKNVENFVIVIAFQS